MSAGPEILASLLLFVSAEHEGIFPDFELEQIDMPAVEYVTPETIIALVYGNDTFQRLSEETVKELGEDVKATYKYESNTIYMNVYAHVGEPQKTIEIAERTTKIHELVHVVQNQLQIFEEWDCLGDAETAAYAISLKYLFWWRDDPLGTTKIRFSFRYLNEPDRNYNKSGNCTQADKSFYEKIILPKKRKTFAH